MQTFRDVVKRAIVLGAVFLSAGLFAAHIYVKDERKTYNGICTISAKESEIWHVQPGGELVVNNNSSGNWYIEIINRNPSALWLEGGTVSAGTLALRGSYSTFCQFSGTMTLTQNLIADAGTVELYDGVCNATIHFRNCTNGATLKLLGGTLKAPSVYGANMEKAEIVFEAVDAYRFTGGADQQSCFAITATTPITQAPKSIRIAGTPVSGSVYALVNGLADDTFFTACTTSVPEGWQLVRRGCQLLLAEPASFAVATATWTGAAGDGNPRTPGNWTCANSAGETIEGALPGLNTTATVPAGTTNFSFPFDKVISIGELRFLGDTYTLNADADWSGIASGLVMKFPAKIDVNGHRLNLSVEPVVTATDLTTPSGAIYVTYLNGSGLAGNSSPTGLIDDNPTANGRFLVGNFHGCMIDYDFGDGQERVVRGARFYCGDGKRCPKDLTIYGTMVDPATAEEGDWTQIVTWANPAMTAMGWSGYLGFTNETAYRGYRLKINDNVSSDQYGDYLEFYELELVKNVPGTASEITSGTTGGPAAVDLTAPGGAVSVIYLNGSGLAGGATSSPAGLIDNNVTSSGRFLSGQFKGCQIVYDFGANQSRVVRGARFLCPSAARSPKGLTVSGTMANPATAAEGDWTPIASRSGLALCSPGWSGYLVLDNETGYRAYRLTINDNVSGDEYGDYLEFYEMELVENVPSPGELHYVVPEGKELQNTAALLSGSLKVVKEGAGSMTAGRYNQTFTGGMELLGGTSYVGGWGTDHRWGPSGGTITVGTNAVFELQGQPLLTDYFFVLNGGTLKNSTSAVRTHWQFEGVKRICVGADSTIDFAKGYSLMDYVNNAYGPTSLDLQGHNLTVKSVLGGSDYCYFSNTTATRGTVTLYGALGFIGGPFMGPETTLDLYGYISPEVDVHVGTYICRTTSGSSERNFDVYVYECFKPLTDMFWGCVLKNGATLDLSERAEAWNVKGTFHTAEKTTVQFEDNATIYIDLGSRKVRSNDQVVAWDETTKPSNLATLKFRPMPKSKYIFVKKETGIYTFGNGLVIYIR